MLMVTLLQWILHLVALLAFSLLDVAGLMLLVLMSSRRSLSLMMSQLPLLSSVDDGPSRKFRLVRVIQPLALLQGKVALVLLPLTMLTATVLTHSLDWGHSLQHRRVRFTLVVGIKLVKQRSQNCSSAYQ